MTEYDKLGVPRERGMEKMTMVKHLKMVALFNALPWGDLLDECDQHNIPVTAEQREFTKFRTKLDQGAQHREHLVAQLLSDECLKEWESKGLPARRIGSLATVIRVAEKCEEYASFHHAELQQAYREKGLIGECILGREDLANTLKQVEVWEAMPAAELRQECLRLKLPIRGQQMNGVEDKSALMDLLLNGIGEAGFKSQGVPAKRIGSFQAATKLAQ